MSELATERPGARVDPEVPGGRLRFGRRLWVVRNRLVSGRLPLRWAAVVLVLTLVSLALAAVALGLGEFAVPVPDVVEALLGGGEPATRMVVLEWRLPRVLLALLLGASLGLAGAVFQSLTRNPLGSPDIIGFNTGAYTGALVVILLLDGGGRPLTALGALVGGLGTAGVVYALAWRQGVQGFRLIIVGIALSAMLASVNTWLILQASLDRAMAAAVWGAGSLSALAWSDVTPVLVALAVLLPPLVAAAPALRLLEMGDDAASALGVRAEPARLTLVVVGVALTALATATAGPIAFVALAAPGIARQLAGSASVPLAPSAAVGACLLLASDIVAQRAFAPTQLPVGVVTVCLGGCYLIWLLILEARRR